MKNTTIAISEKTKKELDEIRDQLCDYLDTKVSYSYAIQYVLEKK
jgi:hypothetical protein